MMETKGKCIGLFGTCGRSKWRAGFVEEYRKLEIPFFNPQVDDWDPSFAEEEAKHLASDAIVLFPITSEEYSLGSLAETGFSALNAIKIDNMRHFVVLIEPDLRDDLKDDPRYKESIRQRALVKQHLKNLRMDNLYLVETLEEMLTVSLVLFRVVDLTSTISRYNPHRN